MLPKNLRITNPTDFYKISKNGKFSSNNFWSIKYVPSENPSIAVVVSKKVNNKASIRNRIKRRTKSLILAQNSLPQFKILIFPKNSVLKQKYSLLKIEFETLLKSLI